MSKKKRTTKKKAPARRGRKSTFDQAVFNKILDRLAQGESLRRICRDDDMPDRSTVARWTIENDDLHSQYARARDIGLDAMVDETLDIADDGQNDYLRFYDDDGQIDYKVNGEVIARSRLRVDTRKWYASKLAPKRYGDRIHQEISGPEGEPIQIAEDERVKKLTALLNRAKARQKAEGKKK